MTEQQDYFDFDLSRLLQAVKRQLWAILLAGLLAALMATSAAMILPRSYEVELLFYAGGNDAVDRCLILLESKTVQDKIIEKAALPLGREELREHLKATPEGEIGFMELKVCAEDADTAMTLAAAVEEVLPHYAEQIQEIGTLQIIDPAEPAEVNDYSLPLWTLAGALMGIFASTAMVLLMAQTDHHIRKEEDVPMRILASISRSNEREDIRKLRSRLLHQFQQENRGTILAFVPSGKQVDALDVSYHQACSLASLSKRVLLVECDFRKPALARKEKLAPKGLAELLCGSSEELISRSSKQENLYLLPAEYGEERAAELLSSEAMKQLLQQWSREFDWVILPLPSLDECGDALGLCSETDAVLLVAQLGQSNRDNLTAAAKELESCGAAVPGVILLEEMK